ncbi:MAG: ribosome silencing factor [Thermoguttaceae bacterium]
MSKRRTTTLPSAEERARIAAKIAGENRGENVVILDVRELTPCFDFFVISTGTSRRQLHAVSEEIDKVFEKELGDQRISISGYDESRWIVLDYGDVLVHLFDRETREYYALEELWGKARIVNGDV